MDFLEDIRQKISDGGAGREWADEMMARYPYCQLPLLLYLRDNRPADRDELLSRLAIAMPDREALALQLGDGFDEFKGFYPPEEVAATPDTETTIDRFLNSFGRTSDKEVEALMGAIFNPQPDYADLLAAQERDSGVPDMSAADEQERLINDFLSESLAHERQVTDAPAQPHIDEREAEETVLDPVARPERVDESMFSESLAKSYIARGKFAQALEIIENISLNYPEKSIYFADQIRFLRKLALNEKHLNK